MPPKTQDLNDALDGMLPDSKIIADIYGVLREEVDGNTTSIELDEGLWTPVPTDVPIFVISKSFFTRRYDIGFGTYRALVSLGAPILEKSGGLVSTYCFSTLYYNADAELITLDFYREMRY